MRLYVAFLLLCVHFAAGSEVPMNNIWNIVRGPCEIDSRGVCIQSPNYPSDYDD